MPAYSILRTSEDGESLLTMIFLIHRHLTKDESFVIIRGKVRSTMYDDKGNILESVVLSVLEGPYGVDIPKGILRIVETNGKVQKSKS